MILAPKLKIYLRLSYCILSILVVATIGGLLIRGVYGDDLRFTLEMFSHDMITFCLVIPSLIISLFRYNRNIGRKIIFWIGILTYISYSYMILLFKQPRIEYIIVYVLVVSLSIFTSIGLLLSIEKNKFKENINSNIPTKLISGIIFFISMIPLLVILVNIGQIYNSVFIEVFELIIILPLFIIVGIRLWEENYWTYLFSGIFTVAYLIRLSSVLLIEIFLWYEEISFNMNLYVIYTAGILFCLIALFLNLKYIGKINVSHN